MTLKELSPVRLLKNPFYAQIEMLYRNGEATPEKLRELLGKGRTRMGMFEGNLDEGELEIGQVSSLIHEVESVEAVFEEILTEFEQVRNQMYTLKR